MSYYRDLSEYCYNRFPMDGSLNVGWLDNIHPFKKGDVSEQFLDRLWGYLHFPMNVCRGFHICEICNTYEAFSAQCGAPSITYCDERLEVGYHEIRVFSENLNNIYAAPTLIFHYITEHKYLPPREFIDAVMTGFHPGSEQYRRQLLSFMRKETESEFYWTPYTPTSFEMQK